jgi:hypothetical protein
MECEDRAEALGLSRSAYIVQLLRQDLAGRGELILRENEPISSARRQNPSHVADDIAHDTAQAVTQYNRNKRGTKLRTPAGATTPPGGSDRAKASTKL